MCIFVSFETNTPQYLLIPRKHRGARFWGYFRFLVPFSAQLFCFNRARFAEKISKYFFSCTPTNIISMRLHHAHSTFLKQRTHMFALHNSRIVSGRQSAAPGRSWTALRMPRSAVHIRLRVTACLVLCIHMAAAAGRSDRPVHTISRFVCVGCEREGQFRRLFPTRRAACIHVGMSPTCSKLGLGVREIRVGAGTGADVMAGGAGAAGPAPDVRHQPPGISKPKLGYPKLSQKNLRISQVIPKKT